MPRKLALECRLVWQPGLGIEVGGLIQGVEFTLSALALLVILAAYSPAELGSKAAEGAGVGGAIGGTVGAILAAIAAVGTTIAIPGLGLVIAGPLAAAILFILHRKPLGFCTLRKFCPLMDILPTLKIVCGQRFR